ncbi:MAG: hypothetical protein EOO53_07730 [Gammaproteobacteria bacterium]|nr:MAG: hypothetical protein EOO53_07730 [Gammaproteobacteria bacterium]
MKFFLIIVCSFSLVTQTYAHCEGDEHPNISVSQELKESTFVVAGEVVSRKILVDPLIDPTGYEAEIFQIKVHKIIAGKPKTYVKKEYLTIYNYNASSRFPMEKGNVYLLFVSEGADGYWINSCGNSAEIKNSQETLKQITKLTTN